MMRKKRWTCECSVVLPYWGRHSEKSKTITCKNCSAVYSFEGIRQGDISIIDYCLAVRASKPI